MKSTLAEPALTGSMFMFSSIGVISPALNSEKICLPNDKGFLPLMLEGVTLKKLFLSVIFKLLTFYPAN